MPCLLFSDAGWDAHQSLGLKNIWGEGFEKMQSLEMGAQEEGAVTRASVFLCHHPVSTETEAGASSLNNKQTNQGLAIVAQW